MIHAQKHWAKVSVVAAAVLLTGCATRGLYSQIGDEFSKGYETAGKIVNQSLGTAVRDTRRLATLRYVQMGDEDTNLDSADVDASFRRYVCAGTGLYPNQYKALEVIGVYRTIIADLSREPSDEIGELWASISRLRQPQKPLEFEEPEANAFQSCLAQLEPPLVPPGGEPIVPLVKELPAIFASYESFSSLVDSVKLLAVKTLQQIDEAARAEAIKQFVLENRDTIARFIGTINDDGTHNEGELKEEVLKKALDIRRRSALVGPYYQFTGMLSLDRDTKRYEIVRQGEAVHLALGEYDLLRSTPDPQNVVKAMRENQAELIRLANGQLTAKQAWGIFKAFADTLSELENALGEVTGAAQTL